MQLELTVDAEGYHPHDCPCTMCLKEFEAAGLQPIQVIPEWFLAQHCPEHLAHLKALGIRE